MFALCQNVLADAWWKSVAIDTALSILQLLTCKMSVCEHCTTFELEVMGIISQCSWQQLRKTGSWALAKHLSLNLHFLPHPASCSAPKSISDLGNGLLTQMFAFYSWLNLLVFPSCGMLAAHRAQVVQNAAQLGKRSVLPSHWWSLLLQELSRGKNAWVCGS